jgi:hypothetical protein
MASGIEAAGLALALLPIVVEIAKAYSEGVNTILNVTISGRRDEKLQSFYDDFWWETEMLHRHIKSIVKGLPNLCPACKIVLESDRTLTIWEQDEVVRDSLLDYFGSQEELDTFKMVMTRVLELFDKLVKEKMTKLSAHEKVL